MIAGSDQNRWRRDTSSSVQGCSSSDPLPVTPIGEFSDRESISRTIRLLLLLLLLLTQNFNRMADRFDIVKIRDGRRARFYLNRNSDFALSVAFYDASCRWHILIVPSNGDADMPFSSDKVVCRVKTNPAESRQPCLDPGMSSVLGGSIVFFDGMKEIATYISARDVQEFADNGNHYVSEILTNTLL